MDQLSQPARAENPTSGPPQKTAEADEIRRRLQALVAQTECVAPSAAEPARQPAAASNHDDRAALAAVREPIVVAERQEQPRGRASLRATHKTPRLGDMLIERELITSAELDAALRTQSANGKRLGEILLDMGAVSRLDLTMVLADHFGVPFVDLDTHPPQLAATVHMDENVARRYAAVPLHVVGDQLLVAMADPKNVFALDDLSVLTGFSILPALSETEQLLATIDRLYRRTSIDSAFVAAVDDATDDDDDVPEQIADDGPIVRLVQEILDQAVASGASDIHIEPAETSVAIRFRVDGMLHDALETPLSALRPMVSRVKVLAGLDIAQNRLPQDGRFSLRVGGNAVDVRTATVPTAAGESVVMRLLDSLRGITVYDDLGLNEIEDVRLRPAFHAPQGAVFVTGPTGSGKSSTLYAMLQNINLRDRSIVSVEDPVEYRMNGVKQIQINTRAGMTFPKALRSILRADPDVILIGEVRDGETARIAAEASVTGHMVLSTLHATTAPAAPVRLIDMGVEPYLVASALTCVVAQRLVRKLCPACAAVDPVPDHAVLRALGATETLLDGPITVRKAVGCERCGGTGYRGRMAIFEIMPVSHDISRLIVARASTAEIREVAIEQGMDTLRMAALRRVVTGALTLDEMARVLSA